MAVNKPIGDNARKGAVKKRSQVKTKFGGAVESNCRFSSSSSTNRWLGRPRWDKRRLAL